MAVHDHGFMYRLRFQELLPDPAQVAAGLARKRYAGPDARMDEEIVAKAHLVDGAGQEIDVCFRDMAEQRVLEPVDIGVVQYGRINAVAHGAGISAVPKPVRNELALARQAAHHHLFMIASDDMDRSEGRRRGAQMLDHFAACGSAVDEVAQEYEVHGFCAPGGIVGLDQFEQGHEGLVAAVDVAHRIEALARTAEPRGGFRTLA